MSAPVVTDPLRLPQTVITRISGYTRQPDNTWLSLAEDSGMRLTYVKLARDGEVGVLLQVFNKSSTAMRNVLVELEVPTSFQGCVLFHVNSLCVNVSDVCLCV